MAAGQGNHLSREEREQRASVIRRAWGVASGMIDGREYKPQQSTLAMSIVNKTMPTILEGSSENPLVILKFVKDANDVAEKSSS